MLSRGGSLGSVRRGHVAAMVVEALIVLESLLVTLVYPVR